MPKREIPAALLGPLRSRAQLLDRPDRSLSPAAICRRCGGMQSQEPQSGRLALRSRSPSLTAADVDRARLEERSVVRTWVMRKTVHLLDREDVWRMLPLFEPIMVSESRRRLAALGMPEADQRRALGEIARRLEADGPLLRPELSESVERLGIGLDVQRKTHLYRLAVTLGIATAGPERDGRPCLILERDWLGERPARHDRDAALAELARRHLGAFGPAGEADLAGWAGLPLRDVRAGLRAIAGEIDWVEAAGRELMILRGAQLEADPAAGEVRMLAPYDTYLMGHRDRDFIARDEDWRRVMPGGGILRATILRDGAALATWRGPRKGRRLAITVEPFADLDPATEAQIEAEVADIGRFEQTQARCERVSP